MLTLIQETDPRTCANNTNPDLANSTSLRLEGEKDVHEGVKEKKIRNQPTLTSTRKRIPNQFKDKLRIEGEKNAYKQLK